MDVETEIDRLYQLPAADFVAARNALAAGLKSAGDKDAVARVRALARPNVAAWAANQTYWTARSEFDVLIDATRRLRSAHAEGAGTALREAMQQRRQSLAAVLSRAQSLLVAAGLDSGQDTLRRVSNTLEALAVQSSGESVHPGRLTRDLEPPGFDAIAATLASDAPAVPSRPSVSPSEPVTEPRAGDLERSRAALADAELRLERASQEARDAAKAQSVAEKREQDARDEVEALARRHEEAKQRVGRAAADAAAARAETESKAAARDKAVAARDEALALLSAAENP